MSWSFLPAAADAAARAAAQHCVHPEPVPVTHPRLPEVGH